MHPHFYLAPTSTQQVSRASLSLVAALLRASCPGANAQAADGADKVDGNGELGISHADDHAAKEAAGQAPTGAVAQHDHAISHGNAHRHADELDPKDIVSLALACANSAANWAQSSKFGGI